jgi:hypothetical protein
MTANIPGARLRDVERRLALLRGEEAINEFIAQHPNETKVLERMVEARRAGKPTPSLTRVQRVMLWSDGEVEFKTDPVPEGRERGGGSGAGRAGGGRISGGAGRAGGDRGRDRGPGAGSGPGGPPRDSARPGGGAGAGRSASGARPGGSSHAGGPGRGGPPRGGPGRPGGGRGPQRGRGRFGDEGRGERGMPRSGEGWVLLREGEKPPEPEPLPEYDWDATDQAAESQTPVEGPTGAESDSASS